MKWLTILLTLINVSFACDEVVSLKIKKSIYSLCKDVDKNQSYYYSKDCKDISKCLNLSRKIGHTYYPNQSPKFTLCYKLGGNAYFAKLKDDPNKIEVCVNKNKQVIGLEYLILNYNKALTQ